MQPPRRSYGKNQYLNVLAKEFQNLQGGVDFEIRICTFIQQELADAKLCVVDSSLESFSGNVRKH